MFMAVWQRCFYLRAKPHSPHLCRSTAFFFIFSLCTALFWPCVPFNKKHKTSFVFISLKNIKNSVCGMHRYYHLCKPKRRGFTFALGLMVGAPLLWGLALHCFHIVLYSYSCLLVLILFSSWTDSHFIKNSSPFLKNVVLTIRKMKIVYVMIMHTSKMLCYCKSLLLQCNHLFLTV